MKVEQKPCPCLITLLGDEGARGVSVMFSSGDGGVGDGDANPATQTCFTNDGTNRTAFIPGFPAS